MKIINIVATTGLVMIALMPAGCIGSPSMGDEPDEITIPLGPQLSEAERQTGVLLQSIDLIQTTYIHSKSGAVDLASLQEKYQKQIDKGLSEAEFTSFMEDFTNEFPRGDILYVTRQERIDSDIATNTVGYGGIGAFVSFQAEDKPHVVILDVIEGSPAETAGLKAHDSIYAVDGTPVLLEEGADVVLRVRGEPGTKVVLTIKTPGKANRDVTLTRATINGIGKLVVEKLPNSDIGYIRLPTVGSPTLIDEIVTALEDLSNEGEFKGLVLDLRIAGTNSNFPLEDMLTLFLDGVDIGAYSLAKEQTLSVQGQDLFGSQKIPLVVLVGENTSGASEIFAAAVQEGDRGSVIGSKTTGSIESLTGFVLPNGGQLYIATASFRVGGSDSLGIEGLNPEVRVDAGWDEIIVGQDPVIEEAIQSLEVQE